MEARHDLLPEKSLDGTALTRAEVVLLNGSQAGSHWVLTSPLTLIGQASNCDIRFNVEEAQPLHCALVIGPRGPILRALQEVSPTYVNDEPIAVCELRADDVVTVGSSCFHVRWSAAPEAEATLRKQEALRLQAAAVAAEQSALTEEEIRLQQRRLGLAQQEKQLSALLEERQQRL